MMTHVERITPIAELNLKIQCQNEVYVVIVMRISISRGNNVTELVFKNCAPSQSETGLGLLQHPR